MKRYTTYLIAIALMAGCPLLAVGEDANEAAKIAFFENKVRPLLVKRCYECHSQEEEINGGLALDSRAGWADGGDSGPAVIPGSPEKSLLIKAVTYSDPDYEMPPDGKLPAAEIEILRKWIAIGAPDPRSGEAIKKEDVPRITADNLWSFQPIAAVTPPNVTNQLWSQEPIDAFVLAQLDSAELTPASPADDRTLVRRLHLDLIGLPPEPETLEATLDAMSQDREKAIAELVDTLLDSPRFGERWGRHWLDLTAYADTIGVGRPIPAIEAYRYRDYVINAFNTDKPLPEFIRQQIAGDLKVPDAPGQRESEPPTAEDIIATGFLAIGPWELVNGDKKQLRMDVVDRQVNRIGKAFLGMTLECARCHDHKFDPVSQHDYFAMAGILRSSITLNGRINGVFSNLNHVPLPETPDELIARAERIHHFNTQFTAAEHDKAEADKEVKRLQAQLSEAKKADDEADITAVESELKAAQAVAAKAAKRVNTLRYLRPHEMQSLAIAMSDAPEAESCAVNIRGNAHQLGEIVPRGFISQINPTEKPQLRVGTSGRLDLAEWITDPANPLTARVWVNRIWHHLYGVGLVRTVDNFGTTGEPPSHPQLLDYLAAEFRNDWSTKNLIRRIVLSQSWQQSSINTDARQRAYEIDPDNRLLWRAHRRRLEAEVLHDAMLMVSGELDLSHRGGPALPLELEGNFNPTATGIVETNLRLPEGWQGRRSVYQPQRRTEPFERLSFVAAFDLVSTNSESGMRTATAIPAQALNLVNSDFILERAQAISRRHSQEDSKERVCAIFLSVLGRSPSDAEVGRSVEFIESITTAEDSEQAWVRFSQSLLMCNEFLFRT